MTLPENSCRAGSADASPASVPTLDPGPLPAHVAIIMDGNGRWAEKRGRHRIEGHAEGAKAVRAITTTAREIGIRALTLYAFSAQNWIRPGDEIDNLMTLLLDYLETERRTILDNGIRLFTIGEIDRLPAAVRARLSALQEESRHNQQMVLTLALSYGAREEIVRAVRKIAAAVVDGRLNMEAIDEHAIEACLFTCDLPPLDLIIRTSGEFRLSNFLLWQAAYAEVVVTETLWPDFTTQDLFSAIENFRRRERRFGATCPADLVNDRKTR